MTRRIRGPVPRRATLLTYAMAAGLAAMAILCREALALILPGIGYFLVLLPAVVVSGLFLGTLPGLVTAGAGLAAMIALFFHGPLTSPPPLIAFQINGLAFIPACAAVLWATNALQRSAAAAAAAEARLAEVFRQIPGAAAVIEAPDGKLLLRSSQSSQILGQPETEIRQADDLGSYGGLHPDGRPFQAGDYPIVRALRTGEAVRAEPIRYRRLDGRIIDMEVYAGPVRGADDRIVAAVGMAFDVSERAAAERRLRESEAEYRAIAERLAAAIDAGALGLWEFDLATLRVRLDAAAAAMFGLPPAPVEISRDELVRFNHPDDEARANAVFDAAVSAGLPYADEVHMVTAQGEERWMVTRGALLPDTQTVMGVIRDVTPRRKREEALHAALQSREILMREADHRIKNSLQLVTSLLRLQMGQVEDADAKQALTAAMARVGAVADAHLALQNSPDLQRIEIDDSLRSLSERVGMLNPAVTVRCDARTGRALDAELAIPLGLIASELLTNALRHAFAPSQPGGVTLSAACRDGRLELTVRDDGVGLPAKPARGGLGTTVVTALARQLGAAIVTESEPGAGTSVTVTVALPAQEGSAPVLCAEDALCHLDADQKLT